MILIQFLHLPSAFAHSRLLHLTGFVIPLIEIMGAMLLLFASTQKKGAAILIATHVFNLIFLGPLGINYNKVVWPWNAVMIVLLAAIYIKNDVKINWKIMLHKHFLWLLIYGEFYRTLTCLAYGTPTFQAACTPVKQNT